MRSVAVFRRRRGQDAVGAGPPGDGGNQEGAAGAEQPVPPGDDVLATAAAGGPWDEAEQVPPRERMDFGSLRVPAVAGMEVQVGMAEPGQAAWITVVRGESGLQLQAFAAPKSGGLWDDVRAEIAAEVTKAGGECQETDGPFGAELRATVTPAEPGQAPAPGLRAARVPVRFLGVDGPRWFLRGVISGPAARRPELARPLEQVFADVVVVRGSHPVPPRDLLEIRLPEQARQALAEAGEEQPEPGGWLVNPFERGPEITETR